MTTYHKILLRGRKPAHGGSGTWPVPGQWTDRISPVVPCERGYHLCREGDLRNWLTLDAIVWEAETDGPIVTQHNKVVAERARLLRPVGVLTRALLVTWACDCAERALLRFEARYPNDKRPRTAIETMRRWLRGEATIDEVRAARIAATATAAFAATATATAAAFAATAAAAAAFAAFAADAAFATATATAAERQWQSARLLDLLRGKP